MCSNLYIDYFFKEIKYLTEVMETEDCVTKLKHIRSVNP